MVIQSLSKEYEVKVDADKYFSIWSSPYRTAKHCSEYIFNVDLLEGEWGKPGGVIVWEYNLVKGGERLKVTDMVEVIDYENKRVEYKGIDGYVSDGLTSFKNIVSVTSKGNGCSIATCTFEFEKLNENISGPVRFFDLFANMNKAIEASLNN
ncbi:hypothetical protein ACFE04_022487 [Oxalis oulophora]